MCTGGRRDCPRKRKVLIEHHPCPPTPSNSNHRASEGPTARKPILAHSVKGGSKLIVETVAFPYIEVNMGYNIFYIIGVIVVILVILKFLGLY